MSKPWWADCILSDGKSKHPIPVYANVMRALAGDDLFKDLFGYDDFHKRPVLFRQIGTSTLNLLPDPEPLTDEHIGEVQQYLQEAGIAHISFENVARGINNFSRKNSFHPVLEYFDSLKWDGVPRAQTWLADICGVEPTPYHKAIGELFLISMIARIREPGCKADYMLVVEGDQGKLKSMLCATLADPWFSDTMPDISQNPKDASMHLRGKLLIEIAEMHAFNKAEATHLKSFISRTSERYRPPYARMEIEEPRQCVFIGTTNKDIYLKDETGGRRFWPFKAVKINIAKLEAVRDQLLAEAGHLYHEGKAWWPSDSLEAEHFRPQQDSRYDEDAWREPMEEFLDKQTGEITLMQVANDALGITKDKFGPSDQNRVKRVLTDLGWEHAGRQGGTGRAKYRRRPARAAV